MLSSNLDLLPSLPKHFSNDWQRSDRCLTSVTGTANFPGCRSRFHYFSFLLGLSLIVNVPVIGQTFIKRLNRPGQSQQQQLQLFPNGDLLIGDASPEGVASDGTTALFLTRVDPCGLEIWSKAYEIPGIRLILRDLVVTDRDQIFLFGSAIEGLRESAFLLEVTAMGEKKGFRIFDGQSPGISPFSIAVQEDKILTFGRLLEIGAETTGFLAIFDTHLNFQWGKKITPFTFEGEAIIDRNGDLVARSSAFHYKFDEDGNLLWAGEFDRALQPEPTAGPVEITGGYLYEAFGQGTAFFYKLDTNGQLVWQSPGFTSNPFPADFSSLPGEDILVHYNIPDPTGNRPGRLLLSPAGNILQQHTLGGIDRFHTGSLFHAVDGSNDKIYLAGNDDALSNVPSAATDFLMQYSWSDLSDDCITWQDMPANLPNDHLLTFPDPGVELVDLAINMTLPGGLAARENEMPYYEWCGTTVEPEVIAYDTLLNCNQQWLVSLPTPDFTWEDQFPEAERLLEASGLYQARNNDCLNPIVLSFQVERSDCDCRIFLPNAFSPNGDGVNDDIRLFSDCAITNIETSVFDRWGNLIYRGRGQEALWDGNHHQSEAPDGIYLLKVDYYLLGDHGGEQAASWTGEVLLIR